MHLVVSNSAPANSNEYPAVDHTVVTDIAAAPANDCAFGPSLRHAVEVNAMVGRVVGHVMSKMTAGPNVDVQLSLVPGRPMVQADPVALSFALSGVLTAQLQSVDDPEEGGHIRISTSATVHGVSVTFSSSSIPPLGLVRAVAPEGDPTLGDPTVAHCRRLIEAQGGTLGLVEQNGRIALRIALPPAVPSNVVPLRQDDRNPADRPIPSLVA